MTKKRIIVLSEPMIRKALFEAREELKRVIEDNEEHSDDLDGDVMEMAEEAAQHAVFHLEEKFYLIQHGKPVYAVVDIAKKRGS